MEVAMRKPLLVAVMVALIAAVGNAIADDATATPYMVLEFQQVDQEFVGLVPEGIRLNGHHAGVVTEGFTAGATTRSIDYFLYRHDGVGVMHTRGVAVHPDGTTIAMTLQGYLGEPMPGLLEAMFDPAFVPPDVAVPFHGAACFETMAPQYAFLNLTLFGCVGDVNLFQNAGHMTCRSLAP